MRSWHLHKVSSLADSLYANFLYPLLAAVAYDTVHTKHKKIK